MYPLKTLRELGLVLTSLIRAKEEVRVQKEEIINKMHTATYPLNILMKVVGRMKTLQKLNLALIKLTTPIENRERIGRKQSKRAKNIKCNNTEMHRYWPCAV